MLEQLPPMQRQALLIGVPAVIGIVAYEHFAGRNTPAADPAPVPDATGTIAGVDVASTDAIGTGQLMDFETSITDSQGQLYDGLAALTTAVHDLEAKGASTPSHPGSTATGSSKPPSAWGSTLGTHVDHVRTRPGQNRGETMAELSQRLYGTRGYANYIHYFNPQLWPGSVDKALALGAAVHY